MYSAVPTVTSGRGTAYEAYERVLYYLTTDDKLANYNTEAGVILAFKFCQGKKIKLTINGVQREFITQTLNLEAILPYLDKQILDVIDYTGQYVSECKVKFKRYFPDGEFLNVIRMEEIVKYFKPVVLG